MSMSMQGGGRLPSTASARTADLDTSRLSQLSNASSINLGGLDYPIGARIGSSGLFVIGDPHTKDNESVRTTDSRLSQLSSHSTLVDGGCPVINKGYDFEYWSWPSIRYACLVLAFAICVALLGATIGLSVQRSFECQVVVNWWQGSVLYQVSVPTFQDFQKNDIGDLQGINDKVTYFSYLGIGMVSLHGFMPTVNKMWQEPELKSFEAIDDRVGTMIDFDTLVRSLHENHIKVLLDLSPVFTSTEHTWFQKSRQQSRSGLDTGYTNLYIWRAQQDKSLNGSWEFDQVRNEYYLHRGNTERPLLNWDDRGLQNLWPGVLEFWLKRGVDGFIVRDIDDFYVTNRKTMTNILSDWRSFLDSHSDKYNRKILMLESSYLALIKRDRPDLYDTVTAAIDLIEHPLTLSKDKIDPTMWSTTQLRADIDAGLAWGDIVGGPWTCWTVASLSSLGSSTVTAMEMLSLMLPGTSSIIAGQEVGKYYSEIEKPLDSDMTAMLWRTGSVFPYIAGSDLGDLNVKLLASIIQERRSAPALQHDSTEGGKSGDKKDFNYKYLEEVEDDTILIRRWFERQDDYYIGVNFGKKPVKRNWSRFTVMAQVVADSGEVYSGNINFQQLVLKPNQVLIAKVTN